MKHQNLISSVLSRAQIQTHYQVLDQISRQVDRQLWAQTRDQMNGRIYAQLWVRIVSQPAFKRIQDQVITDSYGVRDESSNSL